MELLRFIASKGRGSANVEFLLSGCDCLVTCDDRLVRQGQRLREEGVLTLQVINPIDLLREV